MDVGREAVSFDLNTTADNIVERPDENLTVMVRIPGMWGSPLGDLSATVTIMDDGDGSGEVRTRRFERSLCLADERRWKGAWKQPTHVATSGETS